MAEAEKLQAQMVDYSKASAIFTDQAKTPNSQNSPLKVISEDTVSFTMGPNNLNARKSSAILSGTQNMSDAYQTSLIINEQSEEI